MPYIRNLPTGKFQIIKHLAFLHLLDGKLPSETDLISELFEGFDERIHERQAGISREALSNVHGDWYEWLLAIAAWNSFSANQTSNLAVLLPNVSQFDVSKLYEPDLNDLIDDLKDKVKETSQVQLITSNPDFAIISGSLAREIISDLNPITEITLETLNRLENLYSLFISKCSFTQIAGFVSVKTSFRPDRRLQIPHEGSLMKAIYTHLQTRKWIINPPGLKYYAIATKVGGPDREALKTVATHSITTVSSLPQAAVDEVFEVNSLQQAQIAFEQILKNA